MAGLGILIYGIALAISGGKHAIGNMECKSRPMTLPNGIQYYNDMDGKHRLYDGREIYWKQYGQREKVVDLKGNVIYDRGAEIDKEVREAENKIKIECSQAGDLLYLKKCPRCYNMCCWFEYKTGKQLAKVTCEYDYRKKENVYKKYYFYDSALESFKKRNPHININTLPSDYFDCMIKADPKSIDWGDKGVVITKEEYDKIKKEVLENGIRLGRMLDGVATSLIIEKRY